MSKKGKSYRMHGIKKIPVSFGKRKVGDNEPCFITFEAGATHDGLETAIRLVTVSAEAQADAVKFQIVDPDRLIADKKQTFTYKVLVDRQSGRTESVTESLYDILCRRAMTKDEWRQLKQYSESLNLAFFATAGFPDDIEFLEEMGCDSIKIASADVNHWPLIRRAARTGLCIQLDTGNASIGEIEEAVDIVRHERNENIIIHNCPSGYPARFESINLNMITTLKQIFPYPIAFSDHTPGWEMDIAAVALGANLVEKTITEDRTIRSVEHIFSLEPADAKTFVETVRNVEIAMGHPRKILDSSERKRQEAVRRSAFLKEPVQTGQVVGQSVIEFRRPGHGIAPSLFESLVGKHFTRDLPAGHMITFSDMA